MNTAPSKAIEIAVLTSLTRRRFEREYSARSRPCVIRGHVADWPALQRWRPESRAEHLVAGFGHAPLKARPYGTRLAHTEIRLAEYLDGLRRGDPRAMRLYLSQTPVPEPLLADLGRLPLLGNGELPWPNLWLGARGARTRLHRDRMHNLLCQVVGQKRLVLFSPEDDDCLYPGPMPDRGGNRSRVDLLRANATRFPKFVRARRVEVVLSPGDALFLPVYWWHEVTGLGTNISVNFWWPAPLPLWLRPDLERLLRSERQFRADYEQFGRAEHFADHLALATHLWRCGFAVLGCLAARWFAEQLRARAKLSPRERATLREVERHGAVAAKLLPVRSDARRRRAQHLPVGELIARLEPLRDGAGPSRRGQRS